MKRFHVTYYYLATGMEGRPDNQDYGIFEAPDANSAKWQCVAREGKDYSQMDKDWFFGCLTAKELLEPSTRARR